MLVITRRVDEEIRITVGEQIIKVMLVSVRGNSAKIGVDAPRDIAVNREEIAQIIEREKRKKGDTN